MSEKDTALAVAKIPLELTQPPQQSSQLTRLAAFTPTNLTEAMALSKLIASSDLAPKDYRGKPGNVLIGIQYAAELGIAPLTGLQNISIINGRAAVWGDLALALVQSHPDYEGHKEFFEGSGDTRRAVFQIKRKGQEWHQQTFSVQDAKTAKLWGKRGYNGQDTPWITNPDRMLQMRARGFGLRDRFADALKGLRLAEEAMDMPPATGKETGTLDVNREMTTLTASTEPNRGHGNEGMAQAPALSQPPGMDQTEKKQDASMCSECRLILDASKPFGGHHKLCPHRPKEGDTAAQPVQEAKPETQAAQTTPQTVEPPQKPANERMVLLVKTIQERKKTAKDGKVQTYLVLSVIDNKNIEFDMYVWDKALHEKAATLGSKTCLLEFSQKKGQNNRTYCSLEAILEVAGEQAEPEAEEF